MWHRMPPREEVIQAESVKYPDFSLKSRKKENAWLCNNKKNQQLDKDKSRCSEL